jgi:hypothetical protein
MCKYNSSDQIEENEMGRACSAYGRGVYTDLVGKSKGKILLEKSRRKCYGNIKMDIHDLEWKTCIGLIYLRIGTGGEEL